MWAFGARDIILKRRKGINHSKLNSKDCEQKKIKTVNLNYNLDDNSYQRCLSLG